MSLKSINEAYEAYRHIKIQEKLSEEKEMYVLAANKAKLIAAFEIYLKKFIKKDGFHKAEFDEDSANQDGFNEVIVSVIGKELGVKDYIDPKNEDFFPTAEDYLYQAGKNLGLSEEDLTL